MLSFVTSYGTLTVYSLTVLLNSGEITPSAICMLDKFELSDFFVVVVVLFVFGLVVVFVLGFVVFSKTWIPILQFFLNKIRRKRVI